MQRCDHARRNGFGAAIFIAAPNGKLWMIVLRDFLLGCESNPGKDRFDFLPFLGMIETGLPLA